MMLELLAILWHCDGCGAEVTQVDDDNLPTGWSCAVNGDDHHCPSCTLRAVTIKPEHGIPVRCPFCREWHGAGPCPLDGVAL